MDEQKAKNNWFQIEEKEHMLKLQCENKFAYIIFLSKTNRAYIIQELSQDGLYENYTDVLDGLFPVKR